MNRFRQAYYTYLEKKWSLIPLIEMVSENILRTVHENAVRPTDEKKRRRDEMVKTYCSLIKKYEVLCFKIEWCDIQAAKIGTQDFIRRNCIKTNAA